MCTGTRRTCGAVRPPLWHNDGDKASRAYWYGGSAWPHFIMALWAHSWCALQAAAHPPAAVRSHQHPRWRPAAAHTGSGIADHTSAVDAWECVGCERPLLVGMLYLTHTLTPQQVNLQDTLQGTELHNPAAVRGIHKATVQAT